MTRKTHTEFQMIYIEKKEEERLVELLEKAKKDWGIHPIHCSSLLNMALFTAKTTVIAEKFVEAARVFA